MFILSLIEEYEMEREKKFTEKDNKILIDLIKNKLSPLQKSKVFSLESRNIYSCQK